jgi:hypothetical protein
MNGSSFKVGLQKDLQQLKNVQSAVTDGVRLDGNTLYVTKAGAVLDGLDLRGVSVVVQADNVSIKNSLGNAPGHWAVRQEDGSSGLTVENCTFDGGKSAGAGYIIDGSGSMTIRGNEFFNLPSDGVNAQGGTIEQNYFAGGGYAPGAHADAISVHSSSAPLAIRQNYIDYVGRPDAAVGTNAAIKIVPHFGAVRDVVVEGNTLLGGGYTIYANNAEHPATNIRIVNNEVGRSQYGDLYSDSRPAGFVFEGNRAPGEGTRSDVTTPAVEAPTPSATAAAPPTREAVPSGNEPPVQESAPAADQPLVTAPSVSEETVAVVPARDFVTDPGAEARPASQDGFGANTGAQPVFAEGPACPGTFNFAAFASMRNDLRDSGESYSHHSAPDLFARLGGLRAETVQDSHLAGVFGAHNSIPAWDWA